MPNLDDNARRLLQALSNKEAAGNHAECLAALPEFVEAEMAGDDAARLFPAVQAHLDLCESCDAVYAEMLDVRLAEEAGQIPEATHLPPLRMPYALRLRRWARELSGATLDALKQGRRELDSAAQAFFDALAQTSERLNLQSQPQAFALGQTDSEALPLVMASYYALTQLMEQHPAAALRALAQAGQLQSALERAAKEEAKRIGLQGQTAQTFIATFVTFGQNNLPQLLELATPSAPDSSD